MTNEPPDSGPEAGGFLRQTDSWQTQLHHCLFGRHAHFFIEPLCRVVPLPHVQGHVRAAAPYRLFQHKAEQGFPHAAAAAGFIHAEIVDKERPARQHGVGEGRLTEHAEGVPQHHVGLVDGNEHGGEVVREDGFQLLFRVFGGPRDKDIRADFGVDLQHLRQQPQQKSCGSDKAVCHIVTHQGVVVIRYGQRRVV